MTQAKSRTGLARRIEDRVRRFAREEGLWSRGDRVLVAVSGGPDSSALLQVLSKLARREELELTAAHFDHGLRSDDERTEEREAATRLAGSLAVPLVTGSADVRSEARRTRRSLEDAARRGRYDFLARTALTAGCKIVATGHTASDQAETVIMHILRGTGLKGLAGMAPRSSWPFSTDPVTGDLALIRPLLLLGRDETADYCAASGINPIEDASNESRAFLRNRVRHDLLPALREFNPGVDKALVRLAGAVRYDLEYIESVAATALHAEAAGMRLDLTVLAGWPASLRYHALRLALSSLEDDNPAVSEQHILALDRLAVNGRTGDSLNLPMDYIAKRERRAIFLKLKDESPPVGEVLTEASRLKVPGEARAGRFLFSASTNCPTADSIAIELDEAAVGSELMVRRRRPGDRIQPIGLSGTKKLQDLFVDLHVPRAERDCVPVFENARGIVWVGGLRLAGWAAPQPGAPTVWLSYRRA